MKNYLSAIGLDLPNFTTDNRLVAAAEALVVPPLSADEIEKLYHYSVPEAVEGGGCGLKAKEPYQLEDTLGLRYKDLAGAEHTKRLYRLNVLVAQLQAQTQVDWLGVYRRTTNLQGERVLLKEAYFGRFSRAEFPLTQAFAQHSNNTTVGLTGKAIVVQNVEQYEGPYYTCDVAVQSEFCVPILNPQGEVVGIIDAEAFSSEFFTPQRLFEIALVARDLGSSNLLV